MIVVITLTNGKTCKNCYINGLHPPKEEIIFLSNNSIESLNHLCAHIETLILIKDLEI